MNRKEDWENVYATKAPEEVSWYRPHLETSLALIEGRAQSRKAAILDIGGGASTLTDDLLASGFEDVTVLDIAAPALAVARERLGEVASRVHWIAADFLDRKMEAGRYDICHDRAVFHFLNDTPDRERYFEQIERTLRPGGALMVATFAFEGPERCSGLSVSRYDEEKIERGSDRMAAREPSHTAREGAGEDVFCDSARSRFRVIDIASCRDEAA
jgi:SAM-dependent methyltransferase